MATNRLRHFNGCSIEELEPSHLQPRDECPAIDGLSCCGVGTCGHMRPPSKGWECGSRRGRARQRAGVECRVQGRAKGAVEKIRDRESGKKADRVRDDRGWLGRVGQWSTGWAASSVQGGRKKTERERRRSRGDGRETKTKTKTEGATIKGSRLGT